MPYDHLCVIGAGAWGTALAQAGAMAKRQVTLVTRHADQAASINKTHTNPTALGAQPLLPNITASQSVPDADFYILAVPAQASRLVLNALPPQLLIQKPVILSAKGLEAKTLQRQSQILAETTPQAVPLVLSGPSFAADVAAGRPTAVTLAGDDSALTTALAAALAGPNFRPYAADDRVGIELAGALKNIYALACGAIEGANLGASARAAFLARAYAEMARLIVAMGGSATSLTGLAGLGDLTLSCTSPQSRNYQFGMALGRGQTMAEILASGAKLAEGVATTPVAHALAQSLGVDAPLIGAVNQLLAGDAAITSIVAGLMARPLKRED